MTSLHYTNDRQAREILIQEIGIGQVVDKFVVDKGHRNGPERHEITTTGIIVIYNNNTNRLITKLIARPGQLRRYYNEVPQEILKIAIQHTRLGYNMA